MKSSYTSLQRMLVSLLGLIALGSAAYVAICLLLYLGQDRSIFFPRPNNAQLRQQYAANRVEIRSSDATLEGWWIENPHAAGTATLLYFGGNAEDVLYAAAAAPKFKVRQLLAVNYRGYGSSTGKPGQQALYDDGLAIYAYALSRGVRAEQIVVMGRSLGSGVASMLAGARPIGAAILVTPFDSLAAVAAHHFPYLPVRLLLQHPFPSTAWAQQAHAPAIFLAAERDFIVPASHARRLSQAWAGKKALHILPHAGHNDIETHPDYYRLINQFLSDR